MDKIMDKTMDKIWIKYELQKEEYWPKVDKKMDFCSLTRNTTFSSISSSSPELLSKMYSSIIHSNIAFCSVKQFLLWRIVKFDKLLLWGCENSLVER